MHNKQIFYILSIVFVLLVFSCKDKIKPGNTGQETLQTVRALVAVAKIGSKPFLYEAVGTVHARTSSTISSQLMGTVKAVHVREGDSVKKGDLLVEIDDRQVAAGLRKAEAALSEARRSLVSARSARDSARAGAKLARTTYKRYQKLMKDESVSRQEFDEIEAKNSQGKASLSQAEAMVEAATNRVQQAQAAVESAVENKKYAAVRAPYDGKVTAKMTDVGDLASLGTPFLTLEKEGVFCVSLVVPEKHIRSVSIGQEVNVTIPSLKKENVVQGKVGRIDPAADLKSRSFKVEVALPDDRKFRTGVFARVAIPIGDAGIIIISSKSIIRRGQLTGYYLVDDKDIAHFRLLRTGRIFEDSVEVLSGLKNGTRYMLDPPLGIKDGVKVETIS